MIKAPSFWWRPLSLWGQPLAWFGRLYGAIVSWRLHHVVPTAASVPVICVGNLTLGGTGKTPVALFLATHFLAKGKKVGFLTRGYGGRLKGPVRVVPAQHTAREVGDEPLLLASVAPTWVSKDRVAGAKAMTQAGINLIIMDDGHQNPLLYKDLSLVVVDGIQGFGNKQIFPAGPLREDLGEGLARADAVIVVRELSERLKKDLKMFKKEIIQADVEIEAIALPVDKVLAFCGIGNPEKFFASLEKEGVHMVEKKEFPDHHLYSAVDLDGLRNMAQVQGASLVTTEKDWVRLPKKDQKDILAVPLTLKWKNWGKMEKLLKEKNF